MAVDSSKLQLNYDQETVACFISTKDDEPKKITQVCRNEVRIVNSDSGELLHSQTFADTIKQACKDPLDTINLVSVSGVLT